ncbi:MAG TPA: hypothetical protein VF342_13105 [Alphaproteobacteria bacterium]
MVILGAKPPAEAPTDAPALGALHGGLKAPLTMAFLVTLVVGLAAEAAGSTVVAALAMIAYFLYGLTRAKSERNTERFADSLYYLGFIFTLGALFLAMSPWFQESGQITSQNIIQKFGIAILTTFIGMSLRIILLQLRQTVSDQEEEARESIARYVTDLNVEVSRTLTEIREFRKAAVKSVTDAAGDLARQMQQISASSEKAVSSANDAILRSVDQVTGRLEQAVGEVVRRLGEIDVPTDVFAIRIQESADALAHDIANLRNSLNDSAGSFASTLADSSSTMVRIKNEIDGLQRVIASASQSVSQIATAAAESMANNQRFAQTASEAAEAMQRFREEARTLAQALQDLNQRLEVRAEAHQAELERVAASVRAAVDEVRSNSEAFSTTLVTSANALRDAIREVRER